MTWTAQFRNGDWEFIRDGVGHPAVWVKNGIHGCDGGCKGDDFPGRWPKHGDLALCMAGTLGVVINPPGKQQRNYDVARSDVTYPDGKRVLAWIGVNLYTGTLWSSRQPVIIGSMYDIPEPWRPQVMVSRCCGAPVEKDRDADRLPDWFWLGLIPDGVPVVKCFICGKTGLGPERAPLAGEPDAATPPAQEGKP